MQRPVACVRERGVIAGIHADVDLGSLDVPLEAMIALCFTGHTRDDIDGFRAAVTCRAFTRRST